MRKKLRRGNVAAVCAGVLLAGGIAVPSVHAAGGSAQPSELGSGQTAGGNLEQRGASNAEPAEAGRFEAHSGDECEYGSVRGFLSWQEDETLQLEGDLRDGAGPGCDSDGMLTRVYFTAYTSGDAVDQWEGSAEDESWEFRFKLGEDIAEPGDMDELTVSVCRYPVVTPEAVTPQAYCGPVESYDLTELER